MERRSAANGREEDARRTGRTGGRDVAASEELFRDPHRALTRLPLNPTRSATLAEEAPDDAMMAVWEKPDRVSGESRTSTCMYAIVRLTAMRALRWRDRPLPDRVEQDSADPGAVSPGIEERTGRRISEAANRCGLPFAWPARRLSFASPAIAAPFVLLAIGIGLWMSRSDIGAPWSAPCRVLASPATLRQGNVLLMIDDHIPAGRFSELLAANRARIVDGPTVTGAYVLSIPDRDRSVTLARLAGNRGVTLVQPLDR